jgi:anti-sigma B factor antagonist
VAAIIFFGTPLGTSSHSTACRQQIVLDLSHITFCDAAGVRFLLTAKEQARTAGRDLVVRHPSRSVRRVLALTGNLPAICPPDPPPDEEPEPADLRPARANSSPTGSV